jgi:hypothetical protein
LAQNLSTVIPGAPKARARNDAEESASITETPAISSLGGGVDRRGLDC